MVLPDGTDPPAQRARGKSWWPRGWGDGRRTSEAFPQPEGSSEAPGALVGDVDAVVGHVAACPVDAEELGALSLRDLCGARVDDGRVGGVPPRDAPRDVHFRRNRAGVGDQTCQVAVVVLPRGAVLGEVVLAEEEHDAGDLLHRRLRHDLLESSASSVERVARHRPNRDAVLLRALGEPRALGRRQEERVGAWWKRGAGWAELPPLGLRHRVDVVLLQTVARGRLVLVPVARALAVGRAVEEEPSAGIRGLEEGALSCWPLGSRQEEGLDGERGSGLRACRRSGLCLRRRGVLRPRGTCGMRRIEFFALVWRCPLLQGGGRARGAERGRGLLLQGGGGRTRGAEQGRDLKHQGGGRARGAEYGRGLRAFWVRGLPGKRSNKLLALVCSYK
jgi:hypothetical protein